MLVEKVRKLFITHVSRILATHMKFFKFSFDNVVDWLAKQQNVNKIKSCELIIIVGFVLYEKYPWVFC